MFEGSLKTKKQKKNIQLTKPGLGGEYKGSKQVKHANEFWPTQDFKRVTIWQLSWEDLTGNCCRSGSSHWGLKDYQGNALA